MPKYNNSFRAAEFLEQRIVDEDGAMIGTIRIKPSGVLWKPKNARDYFSVSLDVFAAWITDPETRARKRSQ